MDRGTIDISLTSETVFEIDAFDGKKIWCCLNQAGKTPSSKAVILAHGLTGFPFEYIHMSARNYFNERGYDVYRLAFYYSGKENRTLRDCTLEIHGKDLNTFLDYVKIHHEGIEKTFICGHSYGGITMLFANPDATALSFWDSSFDPWNEFWEKEGAFVPELDCYTLGQDCEHLIGKSMYDEAKNLSSNQATEKVKSLLAPASVMIVPHGEQDVGGRTIYKNLKEPKEFHEIKGATHCFTEGGVVHELLDKTYKWFERF